MSSVNTEFFTRNGCKEVERVDRSKAEGGREKQKERKERERERERERKRLTDRRRQLVPLNSGLRLGLICFHLCHIKSCPASTSAADTEPYQNNGLGLESMLSADSI